MKKDSLVLVTGATGYIGGRLVPRLVEAGWNVRCLVRDPKKLAQRAWIADARVEVLAGDAADARDLAAAMKGCSVAYYLIHSMIAAGSNYRERDREIATAFSRAAGEAGLDRIIYLGGLGDTTHDLSDHLTSRREVEEALASGPVPLTVLRAAMIIGSGSASFEILRYLVERLPVMITPKWVRTESQPISIRDTLFYLVTCLSTPATVGRILEIGGPEVLTYQNLMDTMAKALGLRKRVVIPVPILTPKLSSLWIHFITPVGHRIARPLAEGLRNRVVCTNDEAARMMPSRLLTSEEAIRAALTHETSHGPESSWLDAGPIPGDPEWAGGTVFTDRRLTPVDASPTTTFASLCSIGGRHGWFKADWMWKLRGALDRLVGGPGLARGRRHPDRIEYGDVLDFWRVADVQPGRRLELRAEMRLPGRALLEFTIHPRGSSSCTLHQTARFVPKGLAGLLYWYLVYPFHGFVFASMLHGIRHRAETMEVPESKGVPA
jgi:uncharacterized protein YbjT (DUF2867 family)